jgi:L-arabinokinase
VPSVAFYISGHGYGHASRQIEIINALGARLPAGFQVVIRTAAARWLFDRTLTTPVIFLEGPCDSGVIQIDSVRLDEQATARAAADFYGTVAARRDAEAAILRRHDAQLVIADAPPLACLGAATAGIPSIVTSNFTWDWIYSGYSETFSRHAPEVIPLIGEAYALAAAGWRLPMHGGFESVPLVLDLPFVARHAHADHPRARVFECLGIPGGRPVVLSSFGGYGLHGLDHSTLDCLDSWTVVLTGREPRPRLPAGVAYVDEREIYDAGFRYEDLVAAVDVVATKPGYGIISECVANDTAILYTSRGRFLEYDVMVREMPRVLRCEFLDLPSLLAGRWLDALDRLLASPPPPKHPRTDGADIAALMIAAFLD